MAPVVCATESTVQCFRKDLHFETFNFGCFLAIINMPRVIKINGISGTNST